MDECASLRDAVERARAGGCRGDTVLLAPACSSFDMFRDYAERGRAFKDEVAAGGREGRPMARKLSSDLTLFAVDGGPARLRPRDGLERQLRPRPGAARQRLLLPGQAGDLGGRSGSASWWPPSASTTASCATPPSSTRWWWITTAAPHPGPLPEAGERHPPLDPPRRASPSSPRRWPSSRSILFLAYHIERRGERVNEFLPVALPGPAAPRLVRLPRLHPARPRHRRHPRAHRAG